MALYGTFTRLVGIHMETHPVGLFGSKFLWVSDPLGETVGLLVLLEDDGISKCFRRNLKNHWHFVSTPLEITARPRRTGTVPTSRLWQKWKPTRNKGTGF